MSCQYSNLINLCQNQYSYYYVSTSGENDSVYRIDRDTGEKRLITINDTTHTVYPCDTDSEEDIITAWRCYQIWREHGNIPLLNEDISSLKEQKKKEILLEYNTAVSSDHVFSTDSLSVPTRLSLENQLDFLCVSTSINTSGLLPLSDPTSSDSGNNQCPGNPDDIRIDFDIPHSGPGWNYADPQFPGLQFPGFHSSITLLGQTIGSIGANNNAYDPAFATCSDSNPYVSYISPQNAFNSSEGVIIGWGIFRDYAITNPITVLLNAHWKTGWPGSGPITIRVGCAGSSAAIEVDPPTGGVGCPTDPVASLVLWPNRSFTLSTNTNRSNSEPSVLFSNPNLNTNSLTKEQSNNLLLQYSEYVNKAESYKNQILEKISAAETIEDIEAIAWDNTNINNNSTDPSFTPLSCDPLGGGFFNSGFLFDDGTIGPYNQPGGTPILNFPPLYAPAGARAIKVFGGNATHGIILIINGTRLDTHGTYCYCGGGNLIPCGSALPAIVAVNEGMVTLQAQIICGDNWNSGAMFNFEWYGSIECAGAI